MIAKWRGRELLLNELPIHSTTIIQVKELLHTLTGISPSDQKLAGLYVRGKSASDETLLSQITRLKRPHKFILVGTPQVFDAVVKGANE